MNLALNMIFTGISVVFLCLVLLVFIIYAMPKALSLFTKKKFKEEQEEIQTGNTSSLKEIKHEDELIAVITAAVLACFKPEVRSRIKIGQIKRISDKPPVWNNISRNEQINARNDCYKTLVLYL